MSRPGIGWIQMPHRDNKHRKGDKNRGQYPSGGTLSRSQAKALEIDTNAAEKHFNTQQPILYLLFSEKALRILGVHVSPNYCIYRKVYDR